MKKFWCPLVVLVVGYAVVGAYLLAFHFWINKFKTGQANDPCYDRTLYYGFCAAPNYGKIIGKQVWQPGGEISAGGYASGPKGYGYHIFMRPPFGAAFFSFLFKVVSAPIERWFFCWFLSLLALPALFFIGKKMLNAEAGILACAFWIASPIFFFFAHRGPDMFFGTLTAYIWAGYLWVMENRRQHPELLLLPGIILLFALGCHFAFLLIVFILAVDALYRWHTEGESPLPFLVMLSPALTFLIVGMICGYNYFEGAQVVAQRSRDMVAHRFPLGNLVNVMTFGIAVGIPVFCGFVVETFREGSEGIKAAVLLSMAFMVCTLVAPGESERTWDFLAPFFVVWGGVFWARTISRAAYFIPILCLLQVLFMLRHLYVLH